MRDLWGANENDVFHVGSYGIIYHFDGSVWSPMKSGSIQDLYSVWGRSSNDVFAVGGNGTILHYNGNSWRPMESGTNMNLFAIWGDDNNGLVTVGYDGTILRFKNNTWIPMNAGTQESLSCVWGSSLSDFFVGSSMSGTILHFNGSEWTPMNTGLYQWDTLSSIWGSSSSNVYAATMSGKMIHYGGNGSDWHEVQLPPSSRGGTIFNIYGTHENNIYVSGVVSYHFNGIEWTVDNRQAYYAWGVSDTESIFIVGASFIRHFDGSEWQEYEIRSSTINYGLNAVWADGVNTAVAVGFGGGIAIRKDGVWEDHYNGSIAYFDLNDIWGTDSKNIFVVGDAGKIIYFDGNSWTSMESGFEGHYNGVWGSSTSNVFAVGSDGQISHYNGLNWTLSSTGVDSWNAVWGSGINDVFAVSDNGNILHYDGNNWEEMNHPFRYDTLIDVWGTSSTNVFVLTMFGKVLHYDGKTWSNISSGEGFQYLRSIHGDSPSNVLVLEQSGVIHKYNGKSWEKLDSGVTYQVMDIFVDPAGGTYIVGMGGEILYRARTSPPNPSITKPLPFIYLILQDK